MIVQRVSAISLSRYRSPPSLGRIAVDIVPLAMPVEYTPGLLRLADQLSPLHASNSTGSRSAVPVRATDPA